MSQNVKQHTVIQHGELQHAATPMHSKLMAIVAQYRNVNMLMGPYGNGGNGKTSQVITSVSLLGRVMKNLQLSLKEARRNLPISTHF